MKKIVGLDTFAKVGKLHSTKHEALNLLSVKKVICCALGPVGNNIEQAATLWTKANNIERKSEVVLYDTPELCLEAARKIDGDGVVAVFWTCAVYAKENEFFFGNPDVFPFFFQQEMLLDEMQLAAKQNTVERLDNAAHIPAGWLVASHPSPAPLVKKSGGVVVLRNSNAAAARSCANGETEFCITTEKARRIYKLVKLHSFGSPIMVFFGGVTQHGLKQLQGQ
jgi:hypothetical protein